MSIWTSTAARPVSTRLEPVLTLREFHAAAGELSWTAAQFRTEAGAQDVEMSLEDNAAFVSGACLLIHDNPVKAWTEKAAMQARLIEWITPKTTVRTEGPGTDLKVGEAGRTWINEEGRVNCPGGEIFTGPIEDQTDGSIAFSCFRVSGRARGLWCSVRVRERQRCADFDHQRQGFFHAVLATDEGAKTLGEIAFGANCGVRQFSKNTLFDEKIGGTCHMALDRVYREVRWPKHLCLAPGHGV